MKKINGIWTITGLNGTIFQLINGQWAVAGTHKRLVCNQYAPNKNYKCK